MEKETKKTLFKKMVELFLNEEAPAQVAEVANELKFMDIDAVIDGVTVKAQIKSAVDGELNIGDEFNIVAEHGSISPAKAGDYEYNGVIYKVDEAGKIAEVVKAKEEDAAEVVEQTEELESTENYEAQLLGKISEMIKEFTSLKSEFNSVKAENKTLKENFEKFSSQPSEASTITEVKFSETNNKTSKGVLHSMIK